MKTLKAIASACRDGSLDLLTLRKLPEAEAGQKLQEIWGLGPWSTEMFLIFALGREDVFSVGDLGLIRAMETLYDLPKDTSHKKALALAEKWAPFRTFASLLLWRLRDGTSR